MEIVVFLSRFGNGNWELWKHTCNEEEVEGVVDSALAKAADRFSAGRPNLIDYLAGARYIFNVAYGETNNPKDGDTCVHGVCVDGMLIGIHDELRYHPEN